MKTSEVLITLLLFTVLTWLNISVYSQAAVEEQVTPQVVTDSKYTNKDVTPGNPESYVDTYGQCPFYESATKGCEVPADISCNEDWSKCEYIGETYEGTTDEQNAKDVKTCRE